MSGAIVDGNDNRTEVIIEGRSGANAISMQVYQDLYNQITGRSEELTKISKKSIKVKLEDIRQLDLKIHQILEQFNVISANSTFTIFFDKNQKEKHSSIERFIALNSSTNCSTDSIVAKYNFSITLPQTARAQNYTISIRLINRLVNMQKILQEMPVGAPRAIASMFAAKTCELKIEYVDYAVARTVMSALDEWHDALEESPSSTVVTWARRLSHFVPPIFRYTTLCVASSALIANMATFVGVEKQPYEIATAGLIGFLFLFFTYHIANAFGRFVEQSIDSANEISYLEVTKGDQKMISEACKENKVAYAKAVVGAVVTAGLNFVAKYAAVHL